MRYSGEQEKESIIRVRMRYKNPSLMITVCHHSTSLVMPISDPQDVFFYPTLMIDSYILDPPMHMFRELFENDVSVTLFDKY